MKPYYSDETVALYLGDCREVLPALGVTADLIVSDPPYGETSLKWDRWPDGRPGRPSTLAATVRRAILWTRNVKDSTGRFQPSTLESFEFLDAHPELRDAAAAADRYRKHCMLGASTAGLCWWLFHQISPGQGAGLHQGVRSLSWF